jgi:TatD family-associated radical SAM protein
VFCGYGEPMMRAYDIIEICKKLKEKYSIPIRINTNGHANLICGKDITPQLEGLVDTVSISMNAGDSLVYQAICRSKYGERAYEAMLDFAAKCKEHIPKVVLTVVNVISVEDIQYCKEIAQHFSAKYQIGNGY